VELPEAGCQEVRVGDAIGEEEIISGEPSKGTVTAVTPCELLEIPLDDFDRLLRLRRTSDRKKVFDFLSSLDYLHASGHSELQELSYHAIWRVFPRGQHCLAHPPLPELGSAGFSPEAICLVYSGEASLMYAADTAPADDATAAELSPLAAMQHGGSSPPGGMERRPKTGLFQEEPPPDAKLVAAALGGPLQPIATLSPKEVIIGNLLAPDARARWCLLPSYAPLTLVVFSRRDWIDSIGTESLAALADVSQPKVDFFASRAAALRRARAATVALSRALPGQALAAGHAAWLPRLPAHRAPSQQLWPVDARREHKKARARLLAARARAPLSASASAPGRNYPTSAGPYGRRPPAAEPPRPMSASASAPGLFATIPKATVADVARLSYCPKRPGSPPRARLFPTGATRLPPRTPSPQWQ